MEILILKIAKQRQKYQPGPLLHKLLESQAALHLFGVESPPCLTPRSSGLKLLYHQQKEIRDIIPPPRSSGTGSQRTHCKEINSSAWYIQMLIGKTTTTRLWEETELHNSPSQMPTEELGTSELGASQLCSDSWVRAVQSEHEPDASSGLHLPSPSILKSIQLAELPLGRTHHILSCICIQLEEQHPYISCFPSSTRVEKTSQLLQNTQLH